MIVSDQTRYVKDVDTETFRYVLEDSDRSESVAMVSEMNDHQVDLLLEPGSDGIGYRAVIHDHPGTDLAGLIRTVFPLSGTAETLEGTIDYESTSWEKISDDYLTEDGLVV